MSDALVMVILTLYLGFLVLVVFLATRIKRLEALEDARATLEQTVFKEHSG